MKHSKSNCNQYFSFGTQVSAQTKVAHIDLQALMTAMPEMKAAQEQMKKIQETMIRITKTW